MSSDDALVLEDVRKVWHGREAVAGVTLSVPSGRAVGVIGPSGCGKSTLLRMIAGLVAPDRGSIRFGDLDVIPAHHRALRDRTGYVIQEGGLFPHLSARDNIALKARDVGWLEARVRERTDELLQLTHLPVELLERHPGQLSGGQRQRVGIMRALMLDPALLLMDEPLGALDPIVRSRLQVELRGIFERLRKTVVLVTHDLAEAAFLCDEIVLMRDGRIVQRGTMADLRERPVEPFVHEFVEAQRGPAAALAP